MLQFHNCGIPTLLNHRLFSDTNYTKNFVQNSFKSVDNVTCFLGTHTVVIHSILYGMFSVVADPTNDTGQTIKEKVYGLKGLHPEFFRLHTRYVKSK